ncbi:MAG: hypothetical protein ACOY3D_00945 [Candidatus Omnitrophota bacterium]
MRLFKFHRISVLCGVLFLIVGVHSFAAQTPSSPQAEILSQLKSQIEKARLAVEKKQEKVRKEEEAVLLNQARRLSAQREAQEIAQSRLALAAIEKRIKEEKQLQLQQQREAAEKLKKSETPEDDIRAYNESIRQGFSRALAALQANDFLNAQEQFALILEDVNRLSIESAQSKTARQIKESAQKGPEEILSCIQKDKFDEAKKKLWDLLQKLSVLAREDQQRLKEDQRQLLVEGYLKNASAALGRSDYVAAKAELQKALGIDPQNREAAALLGRLEDILLVTKEDK